MYVKIGQLFPGIIGTASFATGQATDADVLPVVSVLDQGTLMAYSPPVAHKATGLYEATVDPSLVNGFAVGRYYSAYVTVVVGGITARAPLAGGGSSFHVTARDADDLAFPAVSGRSLAVSVAGTVDAAVQSIIAAAANFISSNLLDTALATHMTPGTAGAALASAPSVSSIVNAILDELLAGHAVIGSVGDAIAIAAGLLQGNYLMDNTDNSNPNGQTLARVRIFRNSLDTSAATPGGVGEGEFATFLLYTTYSGPNKVLTHRVVRQ